MRFFQFTLNVKFPALDALVQYLQAQDGQQQQIDELTKQVQELTATLGKSTAELDAAVASSPQGE